MLASVLISVPKGMEIDYKHCYSTSYVLIFKLNIKGFMLFLTHFAVCVPQLSVTVAEAGGCDLSFLWSLSISFFFHSLPLSYADIVQITPLLLGARRSKLMMIVTV